MQYHRRWQA